MIIPKWISAGITPLLCAACAHFLYHASAARVDDKTAPETPKQDFTTESAEFAESSVPVKRESSWRSEVCLAGSLRRGLAHS